MLDLIPTPFPDSHPAPRVQFPAEGTGLSPRHQALLPQHQVPAGQWRFTCARGEALLPHLHEAAARGLCSHQALLQLTGKGPIRGDCWLARRCPDGCFTSKGFFPAQH